MPWVLAVVAVAVGMLAMFGLLMLRQAQVPVSAAQAPTTTAVAATTTPLGCSAGDVTCAGSTVVERLCGVSLAGIANPVPARNGLYNATELIWRSRGAVVAIVQIPISGDDVVVNTGNCFQRIDGGLWRTLLSPGFRGSLPDELMPH